MGTDHMNVSPEYAIVSFSLSLVAFVLAGFYLWRVVRSYRVWHDERAAVSLAKAVGLVVVALGLIISASGLLAQTSVLSIVGLSIARGSVLVLVVTLVLADVRPGGRVD